MQINKIGNGVILIVVGGAADVTGVGAIIGVPADLYGLYQVTTGMSRILHGPSELNNAINEPYVCETNGKYLENSLLEIAPGGSMIQKLLGHM